MATCQGSSSCRSTALYLGSLAPLGPPGAPPPTPAGPWAPAEAEKRRKTPSRKEATRITNLPQVTHTRFTLKQLYLIVAGVFGRIARFTSHLPNSIRS